MPRQFQFFTIALKNIWTSLDARKTKYIFQLVHTLWLVNLAGRISTNGALSSKVCLKLNSILLFEPRFILLTSFSRTVLQVMLFNLVFTARKKNSVCNLQYGTRNQLVSGIPLSTQRWCLYVAKSSRNHDATLFFFGGGGGSGRNLTRANQIKFN